MIYNTAVAVVANVDADNAEDAEAKLRRALEATGFDPYDGSTDAESLATFEAEDGTEPSGMPAHYLKYGG